MKDNKNDIFKPLDDEEKDLESLDTSKAYPDEIREAMLSPYRADRKKNVTMRLSESVINALKAKATIEGVPYQTLASMILQKYVHGAFLDKDSVKEVIQALYPPEGL